MDFTAIKDAINKIASFIEEFVKVMQAFINSWNKEWDYEE